MKQRHPRVASTPPAVVLALQLTLHPKWRTATSSFLKGEAQDSDLPQSLQKLLRSIPNRLGCSTTASGTSDDFKFQSFRSPSTSPQHGPCSTLKTASSPPRPRTAVPICTSPQTRAPKRPSTAANANNTSGRPLTSKPSSKSSERPLTSYHHMHTKKQFSSTSSTCQSRSQIQTLKMRPQTSHARIHTRSAGRLPLKTNRSATLNLENGWSSVRNRRLSRPATSCSSLSASTIPLVQKHKTSKGSDDRELGVNNNRRGSLGRKEKKSKGGPDKQSLTSCLHTRSFRSLPRSPTRDVYEPRNHKTGQHASFSSPYVFVEEDKEASSFWTPTQTREEVAVASKVLPQDFNEFFMLSCG